MRVAGDVDMSMVVALQLAKNGHVETPSAWPRPVHGHRGINAYAFSLLRARDREMCCRICEEPAGRLPTLVPARRACRSLGCSVTQISGC
jgi:hypothetical protein